MNKGLPPVKRMSDTCWSARKDATKALISGYDEIHDALEGIVEVVEQKADTRQEARGLSSYSSKSIWHCLIET